MLRTRIIAKRKTQRVGPANKPERWRQRSFRDRSGNLDIGIERKANVAPEKRLRFAGQCFHCSAGQLPCARSYDANTNPPRTRGSCAGGRQICKIGKRLGVGEPPNQILSLKCDRSGTQEIVRHVEGPSEAGISPRQAARDRILCGKIGCDMPTLDRKSTRLNSSHRR